MEDIKFYLEDGNAKSVEVTAEQVVEWRRVATLSTRPYACVAGRRHAVHVHGNDVVVESQPDPRFAVEPARVIFTPREVEKVEMTPEFLGGGTKS